MLLPGGFASKYSDIRLILIYLLKASFLREPLLVNKSRRYSCFQEDKHHTPVWNDFRMTRYAKFFPLQPLHCHPFLCCRQLQLSTSSTVADRKSSYIRFLF